MTPAVRRLLREHGLTAAQIVGTGGGGRITREDVRDFVEASRTGSATRRPGGRVGAAAPAAPAPARRAAARPAGPAGSRPAPPVVSSRPARTKSSCR